MVNDVVLLANGPLLEPSDVAATLGWEVKPEGLCKDETCAIVPDDTQLTRDGKVDALVAADLLDRPAVFDEGSGVAAIGIPRSRRRSALDDLTAPDFTLPDLDGTSHSLSDHRSKKRLLVAFSSW